MCSQSGQYRPEELELVVELVEVIGRGQHRLLGRGALPAQPGLVHRALRPCTEHLFSRSRRASPNRKEGWQQMPVGVTSRDGREEWVGCGRKVQRDGGAAAAPAHAPVGLLRRHLEPHRRGALVGWVYGVAMTRPNGGGVRWGRSVDLFFSGRSVPLLSNQATSSSHQKKERKKERKGSPNFGPNIWTSYGLVLDTFSAQCLTRQIQSSWICNVYDQLGIWFMSVGLLQHCNGKAIEVRTLALHLRSYWYINLVGRTAFLVKIQQSPRWTMLQDCSWSRKREENGQKWWTFLGPQNTRLVRSCSDPSQFLTNWFLQLVSSRNWFINKIRWPC